MNLLISRSLSTSENKTRLTFVGVGPGDPSLLTIAAINAIKESTLVAFPISEHGKNSMASEVVSSFIKRKKCLPIFFPMVQDLKVLKKAWEDASNQLLEEFNKGEKVVFICLGDPSLYATSSYLLTYLKFKHPLCPLKIIPGICSFNAAAAEAQIPLSLQGESLLVIPVPNSSKELEALLEDIFISNKVLVLIKLGKRWSWVREILLNKGLLEKTVFAQKVGFPEQLIVPASEMNEDIAEYFSLLIVRAKDSPFDFIQI